ncbi:efflux RND transporter periplasmic adaptor subunit [Agrobacterium sp. rho-13.3]|uniref:efflux RND transporter periplasmic adaptor subunit n=1 Tax=Agrobacterium sp. rho-13.3 TaxID=3072980 RepID=UPI002A14AD48|nr:efflux RND transporter periplasmic adaptor subunit [Agrobacterium sp. rho-13.3]MDX8308394.1 efflux RND transporter periplasmic adaptor subunit [Agrobacterium sp. rho-13.3]
MKYIITIVIIAAGSALLFVNRDEFASYLPAWASQPAAKSGGASPSADGQSKNGGRRAGATQPGARTSAVTVAVAKSGSLPVVRKTIGSIVPVASTALSTPISGIVAQVLVSDGAEVKAGDLLVQLDDRTIRANIQRDQAVLAKDQAILDAANATLSRVETLSKSGVDTQQQFSDAGAAAKQAAATIAVDNSNLAADNVVLSQTQIRAPFDGKLGAVQFSVGAYVAPGADIVLLTQMKPVFAEFTLPEPDLDLVRSTMASNTLTAQVIPTQAQDNTQPGSGNIVFIDNTVDPASGTFKLRLRLENDPETFWPGQSLKVTVNAGKVDDLVTVPLVALQPKGGGFITYVVKSDKTVEQRKVTVALSEGDVAGLSHGLADGEMVVTEGQASLINGSHVIVNGPYDDANEQANASDKGIAP